MIGDKKVLAVTLARGGSKGIPKKNIAQVDGRPLLQYTTDLIRKSKYIDAYYVSTDDDEIMKVCDDLQVAVIWRPSALAQDDSTSADALLQAVEVTHRGFDYVVEIMATNPLKTIEDIDGCIAKLYATESTSVVSVVRIWDHHPARVKYIRDDTLLDFYFEKPETRRQDLEPAAYVRNGSIYAMTIDFLKENHARYGPETRPYIMPQERTINIDEPIDLIVAESILFSRHKIP